MRLLTTAGQAALAHDRLRLVFLVRLDFQLVDPETQVVTPAPLYFTTNTHTMEHAGIEWLGAGGLLSIDLPQEDSTMAAYACEIALDGLDPAIISMALNEHIEGTPVYIWVGQYDPDTNQPIEPPWVYHFGTVSEVRITPPTSSEQNG